MVLIITLTILSLVLRLIFFNFVSYDYAYSFSYWMDFIKHNGYFLSLREPYANYSPAYLYILTLLAYLPLPDLYSIKIISVLFDFLIALFVMLIIKEKYRQKFIAWLSFFTVLFTPTVILNSAVWGQSDAIYTLGIIAMLYFLIKKSWGRAIISLSLAFTFKLQAIFMFPVMTIYFFRENRIRKYFAFIPIIYLLFILPAYFIGRSFYDLLTIYWHGQINHAYGLDKLTQNAANIYQWTSDKYVHLLFPLGVAITFLIVCLLMIYVISTFKSINKELLIKISLIFSIVIPYFLPRMHERYFFPADIISIIYAFYFPRFYYIPFIVIMISVFTYSVFLFGLVVNYQFLSFLFGLVIVILVKDLLVRGSK